MQGCCRGRGRGAGEKMGSRNKFGRGINEGKKKSGKTENDLHESEGELVHD